MNSRLDLYCTGDNTCRYLNINGYQNSSIDLYCDRGSRVCAQHYFNTICANNNTLSTLFYRTDTSLYKSEVYKSFCHFVSTRFYINCALS